MIQRSGGALVVRARPFTAINTELRIKGIDVHTIRTRTWAYPRNTHVHRHAHNAPTSMDVHTILYMSFDQLDVALVR